MMAATRRTLSFVGFALSITSGAATSPIATAQAAAICELGEPVTAAGLGRTPMTVHTLDAVAIDAGNGS
jgi:hypothetical protein